MTLRTRLILGFGAVTLILTVVGLLNSLFIIRLDSRMDSISEARVRIGQELEDSLIIIGAIQSGVSRALLADPSERLALVDSLNQKAKEFYKRLDVLQALLPDRRSDLEHLLVSFQAYYFLGRRILKEPVLDTTSNNKGLIDYFQRLNRELTDVTAATFRTFSGDLASQMDQTRREGYLAVVFSLLLAVTAMALSIFVSAFVANSLLRPVRKLTALAGDVRRGEYSRRADDGGRDELSLLGRAFNEMAETLARREKDLRASEESYRSLVENASDGVFRTTLEGRILLFNPAMLRILGYEPGEMSKLVGRNVVETIYAAPRDREPIISLLREQGSVTGYEVDFRKKDGTPVRVAINARLLPDESGVPGFLEGMVADVGPLQAMRQLLADKEAAEAASRARTAFQARISHELRTPLNAILGMAEMLAASPLPSREAVFVRTINESGEHLLRLINELLDFSRIESGALELEIAPFSLPTLLESAAKVIAPLAGLNELRFSVDFAPDLPDRIMGDCGRLRQVLLNILGNAVKFTDEGEVTFSVTAAALDPDRVELHFRVSDTGPGVPADKRDLIFESFTQADDSTTRRHGGSGLGLAIAKRIVEMMGGRIWLENGPNRGSVFFFVLAARLAPREREPRPPGASARLTTPAIGQKLRVLAAEDDPRNRFVLEGMLADLVGRLDFVEDGAQAVGLRLADGHDLVLMDLSMPGMDGYQAATAIRELEREHGLARTPIVAVTAHAMRDEIERALRAGCDEVLTKPFTRDALLEVVSRRTAPVEERDES